MTVKLAEPRIIPVFHSTSWQELTRAVQGTIEGQTTCSA
jgi:hypothetical protein